MGHGGTRIDGLQAKARRIDAELRSLGRGDGRARLALGEALEDMLRTQGHHALGFSSIEAYARERCGLGAGAVRQLRAVARRVAGLPRLADAVRQGRVGFSMAELVSRHTTTENEPFLVALAQGTTVAQMRKLFREKKRPAATCGRLTRTVDPGTALLWEQTRMFVEAHCGSRANDAVFEALLGEATTELLEHIEGAPLPIEPGDDLPPGDTPVAPMAAQQHQRRAAAAGQPPEPTEPTELDRRCIELARQLAQRDLRIADLTLDLKHLTGYGCPEAEYAEEVLGMSHSALKARQTLLRRISRLPELQHALEDGHIGTEAAGLLARVATQASVDAWLARAARRTVKHLAEEVRFVERVANLTGDAPNGPPTAEQMAHSHEVERGVLSGLVDPTADGSQTSAPVHDAGAGRWGPSERSEREGDPAGAGVGKTDDDPTAVPPRKMGRVRKTFRLRDDMAHEYRRLERAWDKAGQPDGDFVTFLCLSFWRAWGHIFDDDEVEYEKIYQRERYQCASPTCERRDLTPHHLVFRSQGGTDDPENLIGLCTWCHLHGIHTHGSIKAEAPATRMTWKTPVLEVEGRDVMWRRDV